MSQLSAKVPPAMAVPPVPPPKIQTEPLQAAPLLKVPPVPSVPPEKTKIKTENNNPLLVTVWTPAGKAMQVQAKDAEHAEFLVWANPKPTNHLRDNKETD